MTQTPDHPVKATGHVLREGLRLIFASVFTPKRVHVDSDGRAVIDARPKRGAHKDEHAATGQ